jgi:hypothetical protein
MNARRAAEAGAWILVAAAVARLLWSPLGDPDLFWHLTSGRWMWEHMR